MRISDWSSVVCSSYLGEVEVRIAVAIMGADIADEAQMLRPLRVARQQRAFVVARNALRKDRVADRDPVIVAIAVDQFVPRPACADMVRSEERRVGKECVSTCRSRWSPYH